MTAAVEVFSPRFWSRKDYRSQTWPEGREYATCIDDAIIHIYRNMTCLRVYARGDTLYTAPNGPFSQIRTHIKYILHNCNTNVYILYMDANNKS